MIEDTIYRELSAGSTLYNGKYVIKRVLGTGGFGITYYARHKTLNKHCAIKEFFISEYCMRNAETSEVYPQGSKEGFYKKYQQKFVEEGQTLAKLEHPNIVRVTDVFDENNTSYIVMDFIEGKTLQQLVEAEGRLEYEVAVNYIAQLSNAVAYIHERGVLHRDIKPDNIILTPDYRVVLIDFGSAREFVHDKTQKYTAILTKGYAPPEQYLNTSKKGSYSDIYALGAVFYFALTGKKPIEAVARTMETMPEPKELIPAIPEEANRTIMKAMQLKPENRYQVVSEFMDDLLGNASVEKIGFVNSEEQKKEEGTKKSIGLLALLGRCNIGNALKKFWWIGVMLILLVIILTVILKGGGDDAKTTVNVTPDYDKCKIAVEIKGEHCNEYDVELLKEGISYETKKAKKVTSKDERKRTESFSGLCSPEKDLTYTLRVIWKGKEKMPENNFKSKQFTFPKVINPPVAPQITRLSPTPNKLTNSVKVYTVTITTDANVVSLNETEFSKDSTNWQSSHVFQNLAAGTYTFYVRNTRDKSLQDNQSITLKPYIKPNPPTVTELNSLLTSMANGDDNAKDKFKDWLGKLTPVNGVANINTVQALATDISGSQKVYTVTGIDTNSDGDIISITIE